MAEWKYRKNGVECGPVTTTQLVELAAQRQLRPTDLVRASGLRAWVLAGTVKGLFADGSKAAPLPLADALPVEVAQAVAESLRLFRPEVAQALTAKLRFLDPGAARAVAAWLRCLDPMVYRNLLTPAFPSVQAPVAPTFKRSAVERMAQLIGGELSEVDKSFVSAEVAEGRDVPELAGTIMKSRLRIAGIWSLAVQVQLEAVINDVETILEEARRALMPPPFATHEAIQAAISVFRFLADHIHDAENGALFSVHDIALATELSVADVQTTFRSLIRNGVLIPLSDAEIKSIAWNKKGEMDRRNFVYRDMGGSASFFCLEQTPLQYQQSLLARRMLLAQEVGQHQAKLDQLQARDVNADRPWQEREQTEEGRKWEQYLLMNLSNLLAAHDGVIAAISAAQPNHHPNTEREHIPKEVRHEVWQRDKGRCVECGSKEKLHYDHIIPVSKGGSNTVRNIQLLCEKCNLAKSDKI